MTDPMKAAHLLNCKDCCAADQERDSEKTVQTVLQLPCPKTRNEEWDMKLKSILY